MSTAWSYGTSSSASSGAQYVHVPTLPPRMTCSPSSRTSAAPKSMSFTGAASSSDIKTIFSGLMSRWVTPHEWRWYTAEAICLRRSDATFSV